MIKEHTPTDLEVFEGLLNKAGIVYTIKTNVVMTITFGTKGDYYEETFPYVLCVEVDEQVDKYRFGYMGFYSEWFFDADKNLVTVGHWE